VEGCIEWQRDGLNAPAAVVSATSSYREEQDSVAEFLASAVEARRGAKARASDLYKAYVRWAEESSETPLGRRRFGEALVTRGIRRERDSAGMFYVDVVVRDDDRPAASM
jgi:putative DNA primase/helicase